MNIKKRQIIHENGLWPFIRVKRFVKEVVDLLIKHKLPIEYAEYIIKGKL